MLPGFKNRIPSFAHIVQVMTLGQGLNLKVAILGLLFLIPFFGEAQSGDWPEDMPWWKANNLRVIQTNLPAYEAATLDPDSLVADLIHFSANTLIINAGGIMAFILPNWNTTIPIPT